jgi:hypothetical protein
MQTFGKDSPEMAGMPEVEAFGRFGEGWWAIMPMYQHTAAGVSDETWAAIRAAIDPLVCEVEGMFGEYFCGDVHKGNVMYDSRREQWILTDPSCSLARGTAAGQPQNSFSVDTSDKRVRTTTKPPSMPPVIEYPAEAQNRLKAWDDMIRQDILRNARQVQEQKAEAIKGRPQVIQPKHCTEAVMKVSDMLWVVVGVALASVVYLVLSACRPK